MDIVILGCGYTGQRVARRILARGARVICASRHPENLALPADVERFPLDISQPFSLDFVPDGSLVLHSIPPLESGDPLAIPQALRSRPARVVYLSTTGVYGATKEVNEQTATAPVNASDHRRLEAEAAIAAGSWTSIVLRPAAIYGPGRGMHVSMASERFRLVDGGANFVSRIHVDDLAAHAEAALLADFEDAWPVADDHPCTSLEIAEYCAQILNLPMPPSIPAAEAHRTRRADRRVDGRAIRRQLGIRLQYPSYRDGIPASLQSQAGKPANQ